MASNSVLRPVTARGWRTGFTNLFRKENRDWWGTKSWLVQAIIWTAILMHFGDCCSGDNDASLPGRGLQA
jgi:hypothetical protein